jgi:Dehydrogenases with different specificities (related to short-chain alcohol dehydrogenases)
MADMILILGASSDIACQYISMLEANSHNSRVIAQYNSSYERLMDIQKNVSHIKLDMEQCNLSDINDTLRFISDVKNKYGFPNKILFMAASKLQYKKVKDIEWDDISKDFEIQLHSSLEILKAFLPSMAKSKYGKVLFLISSCTYNVPPKYMMQYSIVKHALLGMMKSLAVEYGDKNVNINGLSPNMVETKFLDNIDSRIVEMVALNTIRKRNISISGVVDAIDFLLSDRSDYINGVNLNLTDGNIM